MMKSFLQILLLVSCATAGFAAERGVSPNGTPFFLSQIKGENKVVIRVAWPQTWPYETGHNPLTPYVGAQLVIQSGAEDFGPAQIQQEFATYKSSGNLASSMGAVRGTLVLDVAYLDDAAKLASIILAKPRLDEKWMHRIQKNLVAAQTEVNRKDATMGWNAIRYAILGNQPYRTYISAENAELFSEITRQDVIDWKNQVFNKNSVVISIAGDIDAARAGELIDETLKGLPDGVKKTVSVLETDWRAKRIWLHVPDAPKASMGYAGPLPPTRLGSEFEDVIAVNILGGGQKSMLFKAIREQLRASYGFRAGLANFDRETRLFSISGEVDPKDVAKVDAVIRATYQTFLETDLREEQVEALRGLLSKSWSANVKKPAALSQIVLESILDGHDENYADTVGAQLKSKMVQDVAQRIVSTFPKSDALVQIVVSPNLPETDGYCVISKPQEAVDCPVQ